LFSSVLCSRPFVLALQTEDLAAKLAGLGEPIAADELAQFSERKAHVPE
jgi:hypothetical protein